MVESVTTTEALAVIKKPRYIIFISFIYIPLNKCYTMQKHILSIHSQGGSLHIQLQAASPVCGYLPVSITASQPQGEEA